jgi:voltage-gated potassium channel
VNLKRVVEDSDTTAGRLFDIGVQTLVLISLISFSIETLPDLPSSVRTWLRWVEVATVGLFTIEYALRLMVATRKFSFVFSFFGLIDLVAIIPFYLSLGMDLRSIRVVRFLRIFRILKLARYSRAIERFREAIAMVREELVLFSFAALVLLYVSAVGIYFFERDAQPESFASIFHSLWWALATLTTVGYGDVYPVTLGGRLFTFVILVVGLGIIAVPTGIIASALSKVRELESTSRPAAQQSAAADEPQRVSIDP